MHFIIDQPRLRKALDVACGVAERGGALPVLQNVLIQTTPEGITLKATNGEALASMDAAAEVIKPGRTTAPADRLKDIVSNFGHADKVTITESERRLVLKSGKKEYKLMTIPAEDFPEWQEDKITARFDVEWDTLKNYLNGAVYALPAKDHRRVLLGILAELSDAALRLTATDGKKLSRQSMPVPESDGKPCKIVIPRDFADTLIKHATLDRLTIEIGERQIAAACPALGFTLRANGIDGKYPDCDSVIPKESAMTIKIDRAVFVDAAKGAGATVDDKNKSAIFRFTPEGATVTSAAHDVGAHMGEFSCEGARHEVELAFNVAFLMDTLSRIPTSEVEMNVKNSTAPVVFRAPGHGNKLWLLMPIKLSDLKAPASEETEEVEE